MSKQKNSGADKKSSTQKGPSKESIDKSKDETQKEPSKYVVVKSFRDKDDFTKEYKEGQNVSSLDKERLEHLVGIGYVKVL